MRNAAPLIAGVLVLVAAACGDRKRLPTEPGGGGPDPSATFTRVQGEIFAVSCALSGCHTGSAPAGGMDLSPSAAYGSIVNVPSSERSDLMRIDPGRPEGSYLIKKLRGDPDISGSRMPLNGSPLGPDRIQLVTDWVLRGAPRD
ncbi:MAG: hypothetical protein ACM3O7_06140 [Acidobacteriota bacterium]